MLFGGSLQGRDDELMRARISREAPAAAAVPGKHGTVGCAVDAAAAADPRAQRVTATRLARG